MRFVRFASVPFRFFSHHSSFAQRVVSGSHLAAPRYGAVARCLAAALFVLAAATSALSQSDRGTIAGTVLDASGAAVQGATITATNANTGAIYKTASTDTGAYRIPDMQVGVYNVTFSATGFKTSEQKGVVVQINTTASLDVT